WSGSAYSQKNDPVKAVITYAFSHLRDTSRGSQPYTENMNLILGTRSSLYKSGDKVEIDSIVDANYKASGYKVMSAIPYTKEQIDMDYIEQKLVIYDRFFEDYQMKDDWPVIDWEIQDETSVISGLNCQKAIGKWKGRTYIAWFSSELPYRAGPWKLNGLPGLIIEAYDTDREVIFNFAGFRTVPKDTVDIQPPSKAITTTKMEFNRMKEAFYQDLKGSINATTGKKTVVSVTEGSSRKSREISNPLELPDQ